MLLPLLLSSCLLGPVSTENSSSPVVGATYDAARAGAGKRPEAHVRLALWCEAHGMPAERLKHLAIAALLDPGHATARGLLGLVREGGKWRRPEEVEAVTRADRRAMRDLAEYGRRRAEARNTVTDQWELARWCEQKGLMPESRAHLTAVVRLDPSRSAAWNRLGRTRHRGRWMTEEEIGAERVEREAQAAADVSWIPLLSRRRMELRIDDERGRAADRALAEVVDPRAVPAVWRVFVEGDRPDHARAAAILGQIDAPASTHALTLMALFSPGTEARRRAMETLAWRDPRDVAGRLVGLLRDPKVIDPPRDRPLYRFTFQPIAEDDFRSPGLVRVESRWLDALLLYTVDETIGPSWAQTPGVGFEHRAQYQRQRQGQDFAAIVRYIQGQDRRERAALAPVREFNDRVLQVLALLTKQDFGPGPQGWRKWWTEELGYAYDPSADRSAEDVDPFAGPKPFLVERFHYSCFGAGTPVRTRTGLKAIETLRVGDRVLAQDTTTGSVGYEPVVAIAHNPPAETLRIKAGDEEIVATGIHRFWKAGRGWVMARALKAGDTIRTVGGLAQVVDVKAGSTRPVYNLEVDGRHSFFVGRRGLLVHDNSPVLPAAEPFDAVPSLAMAADAPAGD